MESESVSAKSVNQRIGVSGIATAFRIISRFCLNRIWLEELNQLCPRITGMTLEESLESRGHKRRLLRQTLPAVRAPRAASSTSGASARVWVSLCSPQIWTFSTHAWFSRSTRGVR